MSLKLFLSDARFFILNALNTISAELAGFAEGQGKGMEGKERR